VASDQLTLKKAAVNAYVNGDSAATRTRSSRAVKRGDRAHEYSEVAEGDLAPRWPTSTRPRTS